MGTCNATNCQCKTKPEAIRKRCRMYVIVGRSCEHTTCRHPACPVVHDIYDHHDGTVPPIHCTACHQRAFADVRTDGRELIVRCPHCGNQAEYVKRRGRAVELNTRAGEPAGKE